MQIRDDAPIVEFVADNGDKAVDIYDIGAGQTVTGILDIAEGADGLASATINGKDITTGTAARPVTITDQDGGVLEVWNDNGTYRYSYTSNPDSRLNGQKNNRFTLKVVDNDGDEASDILTMNVHKSQIAVGTNDDNSYGSRTPWHEGNGSGHMVGGHGNDVLIGDTGGLTSFSNPTNVTLMMDYSGSMVKTDGLGVTREAYLKDAVGKLLVKYAGEVGTDVKVCLIAFATNARDPHTVTFTKDMTLEQRLALVTDSKIAAMLDFGRFDGITDPTTQYIPAFTKAAQWMKGQLGDKPLSDADNQTIFLTDGKPQDGKSSNFDTILNTILNNQSVKDVHALSDVRAIGIALSQHDFDFEYQWALRAINALDDTGKGIDTTNASEIWKALDSLTKLEAASAGSDYIQGGNGDNIIFGDVVNTDALAQQIGLTDAGGNKFQAGEGWAVFERLEELHWNGSFTFEGKTWNVRGWDRDTTLEFIKEHHDLLSDVGVYGGAGREGGDDIIVVGGGNDIIYGQEGNDIIVGGSWHYKGESGDAAFRLIHQEVRNATNSNDPTVEQISDYLSKNLDKIGMGDAADGNNILMGGDGNNLLIGGGGNDTLYGGQGSDTLFGGGGENVFIWKNADMDNNVDTIFGFKLSQDKLCFSDLIGDSTDIGTLLSSNKLSLSAKDMQTLTMTVDQQTIEIQLDSALSNQEFRDINSNNYNEVFDMLEILILTNY